jgi:hypothetical protein
VSDTRPASSEAPADQQARGPGRNLAFPFLVLTLLVLSGLAATWLARWLNSPGTHGAEVGKSGFPGRVLQDWQKPDLVILLTGQQHGYLLPCGCSDPQIGGLERRYNLLQMFKAQGWPWAAVDLGDVPQRTGPAELPNQQGMIKYIYSMRAMKTMGYQAVGFAEYEVNLGLSDVLANFALNDAPPYTVATNLQGADKNFPDLTVPWKPVDVKPAGLRLGVVSITGPMVAARIKEQTRGDTKLRFGATRPTLDNVLAQLKASKVDIPILLYQGPIARNPMKPTPPTEGIACAEAYPQFPIVLCQSVEDDTGSKPHVVEHKDGRTSLVITLGHKGKFVGVVGVWKTGKPGDPYRFRYERVEMNPDFKTPDEKKKDHPIIELMESYTRDLRDKKYLEAYPQVGHVLQQMAEVKGLRNPVEVTYAGSEACKRCHDHAYDIWKKTPHSHAYKTLVDAKWPSNRQYDPECVVCHTVGFGIQSGYVNETKTAHLKDVGCESCHGPSSVHVKNPSNIEWQKRINPWKYLPPNKKLDAMDQLCQKCHDEENDVTYKNGGFKRKWPKVEHMTPNP